MRQRLFFFWLWISLVGCAAPFSATDRTAIPSPAIATVEKPALLEKLPTASRTPTREVSFPTAQVQQSRDLTTSVELGKLTFSQVYTDALLGFRLEYPASWNIDPSPSGFVMVWARADEAATQQFRIVTGSSVSEILTPENVLESVRQGPWGQYVDTVAEITIDEQPALAVTMKPIPDEIYPPQFLATVIAPYGQGLTTARDSPLPLIISGTGMPRALFNEFLQHVHFIQPE